MVDDIMPLPPCGEKVILDNMDKKSVDDLKSVFKLDFRSKVDLKDEKYTTLQTIY